MQSETYLPYELKETNVFRRLIIGRTTYIDSWSLYKRLMLTGNLTLLGGFLGLVFTFFEVLNGRFFYIFVDSMLVAGAAVVIIMLRSGLYVLGRLVFLLVGLMITSYFFMVEPVSTGTFSFYFVVAVASLTIFGFERFALAGTCFAITLTTGLAIFIFELNFFERPALTVQYIRLSFILDYLISSGMIFFMIFSIMSINYKSIRNIRKRDEELKRRTRELGESRSRFELALQGSRAGIWDWNIRNDTIYLSPILRDITGYKQKQNRLRSMESLFITIHPDDRARVREALHIHLTEKKLFQTEFRFLRADKSYIWVLDSGQAEWDENGEPIRMVGSLVDISERKASEKHIQQQNQMLEKTNKELDRFVYSVSHDLKSPLSSVLGLMSITEMTADVQEIRKCLGMMRNRINALNGFIEEIINYSRNSRTEASISDEILLYDMVHNIMENLQFMEKMDKIDIRLDLDRNLKLLSDAGRLKIILNNLIGNAIKYHDIHHPDPFIRLTARVEETYFEIVVEDNGFGIHPDMQERIFEMFYRASEESQGSGLGLYIAREMATKLKGTLLLESAPGQGAKFILNIPLQNKD